MGFPRPRTTGDMSLTFKRCGNFDPFIAKTDATSTTSALEKILSRNGSVVLYVSYRKWHMVELTLDFITVQDYLVDLTSYDYDAPISKSGDVDGAKFKALRAVIAKYSTSTLPPVPLNNEKTGYGRIKLEKTASFFDALDSDLSTEAIESENSISVEAAGQMFRFLLYASEYTSKGNGNTFSIPKVHDRAQLYVTCLSEDNRAQPEYIGTIDRWSNKHVNLPNAECASSSRLLILVQDGFCAFHRNRQPKERLTPQLHESAGGLPSLKLSLHTCSVPGSTNAIGIETSIALVLPAREHECDTSFVLRRPSALS
ncbi:beta-galactosidase 17 [Tanacetum coccineum]